jgi:hypothetical protein
MARHDAIISECPATTPCPDPGRLVMNLDSIITPSVRLASAASPATSRIL